MEIEKAKMELRAHMRAAFDNTARETASVIICEKLRALPEWQAAKVVMGYAPLGDEPDIEPLLCATRATALPRWTDDERLEDGLQSRDWQTAFEMSLHAPGSAGKDGISASDSWVLVHLRGRRLDLLGAVRLAVRPSDRWPAGQ